MQKSRRRLRDEEIWPARLSAALGLAVLLATVYGSTARSQSSATGNFGPQVLSQPGFVDPVLSSSADVDMDPAIAERLRIALNIQRQKQIVADSDKLLKLTRELNAEVAADGSGSLTSKQLRMLNQIEKLAHSVKERMLDTADQPGPALSSRLVVFQ